MKKQPLSKFIKNVPFKSPNKIQQLIAQEYNVDLDKEFIDELIPKLNNYNVKEAKKKYSFKTFAYPNSFIGDLFFPNKSIAFLLLIDINTRKAFAYHLGDVEEKEIINVNNGEIEYYTLIPNIGLKTTTSLLKAFNKFRSDNTVNSLRFDGESAINSKIFQKYFEKQLTKLTFFCIILSQSHRGVEQLGSSSGS